VRCPHAVRLTHLPVSPRCVPSCWPPAACVHERVCA
jgi:hypothetical protein